MQWEIARADHGLQEVRLKGRCYNPHWTAALFSALSGQGISVVAGEARRDENQDWTTRLLLDCRRATQPLDGLDFAEMTRQRLPASISQPPELSHFAVQRRPDASLEMFLAGPDQIGFLGRVLVKVSALGLYPLELEIRTVGGMIRDRVVLRGIAGAAPDEAAASALQMMLGRFVPAVASPQMMGAMGLQRSAAA